MVPKFLLPHNTSRLTEVFTVRLRAKQSVIYIDWLKIVCHNQNEKIEQESKSFNWFDKLKECICH